MSKPSSPYLRAMAPPYTMRDPRDFYPTPAWATRALLMVEKFEGEIWEPACGRGDMAREMEAAGYQVRATDLYDYSYGAAHVDFLNPALGDVDNIMTNPPFALALEFARLAARRARRKAAMLVRLGFLETATRAKFFRESRLSRVWVFPQRVTMWSNGVALSKGGGKLAFAWFIWDRNHRGPIILDWLPERQYVRG